MIAEIRGDTVAGRPRRPAGGPASIRRVILGFAVLAGGGFWPASAAPAQAIHVYNAPFHQSPVRGDPGDLLVIGGWGFAQDVQVFYMLVEDSTKLPPSDDLPLPPPTGASPQAIGWAEVASVGKWGDSLVVRLPAEMTRDETYGLWLRNGNGPWSEPVLINDARPLWITPEVVTVADLPREMKVVGRNLQPAPPRQVNPEGLTRVRMSGPAFERVYAALSDSGGPPGMPAASALPEPPEPSALDHYVARVFLEPPPPPGRYEVSVSRDGQSWVAVGQAFEVESVAPAGRERPLACDPGDEDVTSCIERALADAVAGDTVVLGPGVWRLRTPPENLRYGLIVPRGVSLRGSGRDATVVRTMAGFSFDLDRCAGRPAFTHRLDCLQARTAFTLIGDNVVSGIHFEDAVDYGDILGDGSGFGINQLEEAAGYSNVKSRNNFLLLGPRPRDCSPPGDCAETVDGIVIRDNSFSGMLNAVGGGGLALEHLFVVDNRFNAEIMNLRLDPAWGYENLLDLRDSAITGNEFVPSSHVDPGEPGNPADAPQGVLATSLHAGTRLDFSENRVIGGRGLGWRAGHFFYAGNSLNMLVSQNYAACVGEKANDGEWILYDPGANENAWTGAYERAVATGSADVTVEATWGCEPACSTDVLKTEHYRDRFWILVARGRGLGQARRIRKIEAAGPGRWRIEVEPAWDVPPVSADLASMRQAWQTYVVRNTLDTGNCDKANPDFDKSGRIEMQGTMTDSAIEANVQIEADGIGLLAQDLRLDGQEPRLHYFNEIRGNRKVGEYRFDGCWVGRFAPACNASPACCPGVDSTYLDCPSDPPACAAGRTCPCRDGSWSGISITTALNWNHEDCSKPPVDPPVVAFANSISHNVIVKADAQDGGAIAIQKGGGRCADLFGARMIDSSVIFRNRIEDVMRLDRTCACLPRPEPSGNSLDFDGGTGIHILRDSTHNTVLSHNTIAEVCYPIIDAGSGTIVHSTGPAPECPGPEQECASRDSPSHCTPDPDGCVFVELPVSLSQCARPDKSLLTCPQGQRIQEKICACPDAFGSTNMHLVCSE